MDFELVFKAMKTSIARYYTNRVILGELFKSIYF